MSSTLQEAWIEVVGQDHCKRTYGRGEDLPAGVTDQVICAGDTAGGTDSCQVSFKLIHKKVLYKG